MAFCQSKSTSKTGIPKYILQKGKSALDRIDSFSRESSAYTGPRVADLSGTQTSGLDMLRDYAGTAPDVTDEALGMVRRAASGDVDLNPYIDAVLNPQIRRINEAAGAERKRIGDMASTSSAYGDARHGLLESELGRNTEMAIGDVTGQAYKSAWDDAIARAFQGASGLTSTAAAGQANKLGLIQSLLSGGAIEQQTEQNKLDAKYQEFMRQLGDRYDRFNLLLSALTGVPYERKTTTTQPDNSPLALVGGLAGSFF